MYGNNFANRLERATRPLPSSRDRRRRRRRRSTPRTRVQLQAQPGEVRCPFCHEDIEVEAATYTCSGCSIQTHSACVAEIGRCPTLGCGEAREASPNKPIQPIARRRSQLFQAARDPEKRPFNINQGMMGFFIVALIVMLFLGGPGRGYPVPFGTLGLACLIGSVGFWWAGRSG